MMIYPAIDLVNGKCVRLIQGRFDAIKEYEGDPVAVAQDYASQGAKLLHVVDLDGAREGASRQRELIERIAREGRLTVQAGGGIRSRDDATQLFDRGVARVVVGSLGVKSPHTVRELIDEFGADQVALAADVEACERFEWRVRVSGWREDGARSLWEVLDSLASDGLKHVLCTDIGRDGTLSGPNRALYRSLVSRYPQLAIQASGGVGELFDLKTLKAAGVAAAVIGKALFDKHFRLSEALRC